MSYWTLGRIVDALVHADIVSGDEDDEDDRERVVDALWAQARRDAAQIVADTAMIAESRGLATHQGPDEGSHRIQLRGGSWIEISVYEQDEVGEPVPDIVWVGIDPETGEDIGLPGGTSEITTAQGLAELLGI